MYTPPVLYNKKRQVMLNCSAGQQSRLALAQFGHRADESAQSSSVRPPAARTPPGNCNRMNGSQMADSFDFGA
jgi:hypothetical protein